MQQLNAFVTSYLKTVLKFT